MGLRQEKQKVRWGWMPDVETGPTLYWNCTGSTYQVEQLPRRCAESAATPTSIFVLSFHNHYGDTSRFQGPIPGAEFCPNSQYMYIYIYIYIWLFLALQNKSHGHTAILLSVIPSFQLNFYCLCNNIALNWDKKRLEFNSFLVTFHIGHCRDLMN